MTLKAPAADHPLKGLLFEFNGKQIGMHDVENFTADDILKLPDINTARRLAVIKYDTSVTDVTDSQALFLVHFVAVDNRARVILVSFYPSGKHRVRWSFGRFSDPRKMMHLQACSTRSGTACGRAGPSTGYPIGNLRITCPNCLLDLAAAHNTTPDKLYEEDAAL